MTERKETSAERSARLDATIAELTAHLETPKSEVLLPIDYSIAYVDLDRFGGRASLVTRLGRSVPSFTFQDSLPTLTKEFYSPFWREHHFSPQPLDSGPLVLIETQNQGGFCIALSTGELTWGNKSAKQQHIVTSVLSPDVLSEMDLAIGDEFQFAQKAPDEDVYGENDLHVLEPTGPIKKILVTSPLSTVNLSGGTFEVDEGARAEIGLTREEAHLLLSAGAIDPSLRHFMSLLYGSRRGNEELNDASVVFARRSKFNQRIDKAEHYLLNQRLLAK